MKGPLDSLLLLAGLIVWCFFLATNAEEFPSFGPLVKKESRRTLVSTESGVVTAVDVHDGLKGAYHLQFITLEPSSLFLPVLLHADMVFYVRTGRGTVSWAREDSKDGTTDLDVERGDVYRIEEGSIVYVRSHSDPTREKLRIQAIFNNFNPENPQEAYIGAYSNVSDLVRGFDDRVLQMGFKVSEEDVQAIKWAVKPPPIVHFAPNKTEKPNWNEVFETLVGGRNPISLINGKKKGKGKSKTKTKTFNVFNESPDVKNCNGWSVAVTNRNLKALEASDIGVFMVNLTKGAMMGPHWNPKATEISIVLQGHGMVQVVCPSSPSGKPSLKCQTMRFMVNEGDVFIVPRFHPMAQMSFNNDSFVFMGFSTAVKNNHPQYLAGKWSVLRTIDKEILAMAFGASNTTVQKMFRSQEEGVMLECTSCAEEAEKIMQEEIQRKKEEARKREEKARREEEEARKREEEEARKREEEARKKKEEEEARKREEEEARKREEQESEREEARKKEEEAKKREEEEERKSKEEEKREEQEREREEARKKEEEEKEEREREEARKKEEEEARKREEEEERKSKEEEARRKEEEEIRRQEEEEIRRQEEEAREREAGGGDRKGEEEEEERKSKEEEARRREEEEIRRQEEEEIRRQEEEAREREAGGGDRKGEKESGKSQGEEEEVRRQEEEEIRRQEEEEIRRQEEEAKEREAGGGDRKREEEAGQSKEEETGKREGEEEAARRQEEEEIRRQEEEEYRRQEEEAREREAGGEEVDEERRGRYRKTSGAERFMSRKLWSV